MVRRVPLSRVLCEKWGFFDSDLTDNESRHKTRKPVSVVNHRLRLLFFFIPKEPTCLLICKAVMA